MKNVPICHIADQLGFFLESKEIVLGYQIDSRNVGLGDLYFALPGNKFDGHDFLEDVKRRGAIGAVVRKDYFGPDFGLELIRVEDVAMSLRLLAYCSKQKTKEKVVAITGSVGKTTTKDFVATLLSGKFKVGKTLASQNSKLTFPLTILNRDLDLDVLVLEMGMGEPGDIRSLCQIVAPDIGVITSVGHSHAEFFPLGLEQVAQGKFEIFSQENTSVAIFDHELMKYEACVSKISGSRITFSIYDQSATVHNFPQTIGFDQDHFKHNFLAAWSVCLALGLTIEDVLLQIPLLKLPKMRCEKIQKNGLTIINDAYNASPESMKAALKMIKDLSVDGRKIAVLGSMKELGLFSEQCHRQVGSFSIDCVDILLCYGQECSVMVEEFVKRKNSGYLFLTKEDLLKDLTKIVTKGDVILLKGSRSMNMETILDEL